MNQYNIIKKLGEGVYGKVYLAEYNKDYYAIKIQGIDDNDLKKNYRSRVWREIKFSEISKLYPDQFSTLYEYSFPTTKRQYPNYDQLENYSDRKEYKKARSYKNIIFSYSLKDGVLKHLIYDLTREQLYSLFIQMAYISYILSKNNYRHNDVHLNNIMYKKVDNDKTIKIFNRNIPTFGYIFCLVDYGLILHPDFDLSDNEKNKLRNNINDFDLFADRLIHRPIIKLAERNKIHINYNYIINMIKNDEEYEYIKKYLTKKHKNTDINISINIMLMINKKKIFNLMNMYKYKNHFDKNKILEKVDKKDIICLWKNIEDPIEIINHFYNKLY